MVTIHATRGHVATVSAGTMNEVTPDEMEANSKLIASAPDLLRERNHLLEVNRRLVVVCEVTLKEAKNQAVREKLCDCNLGECLWNTIAHELEGVIDFAKGQP